MPLKDIVAQDKSKMEKTVEFFANELKSIRTSRASAALVDNIKVEYYGTPTALKQLASITVPQSDMIIIKPFDPSSAKEIEKAIKNSALSLAPLIDGKIIRLNIPPLSEERRKQLVAQVKQTAEQTKITVRNIRRDAIKVLEKEQKDGIVTEDDLELGKKQIDDITKEFSDKIDSLVKTKSDEIMLD